MSRRLRNAVPTLSALAIGLGIVALAEVLVRTLGLAPRAAPPLVVFDPTTHRPIAEGEGSFRFDRRWLWEPRPDARVFGSRNNADAYRGPALPREPRADAIRIACLGDSTTFGFGLPEPSSYPRLLEGRLRDEGVRADVLNFGVVGFSALQGLRLYQGRVREYRPDVVIAAFGAANDQFRAPLLPDAAKLELVSGLAYRVQAPLTRLALYRLGQSLLLPGDFRPPENPEAGPRVPLPQFREALGALAAATREDGAELLLVSPPRRADAERAYPATLAYTDAIAEVAQSLGTPLCDVRAAFRQQGHDGVGAEASTLFMDRWHPSLEGHALYARLLAACLRPLSVFAGSAARAASAPAGLEATSLGAPRRPPTVGPDGGPARADP